jgi:hypothetical protein
MSAMPTAAQIREYLGANGANARCPAHEDEHGSLSINDGENGKTLLKCHAGCSQVAVIEALQRRGIWPKPSSELTVAELAAAKGLPEKLLLESGCCDDTHKGRPVIRMEYRDASGNISCLRYRGALAANGSDMRFWFRRGDKQQLFGLWRLKPEPVIVVEGETDAIALWSAGFNSIGVPSAAAWKDARFAASLNDCHTVFVHVEPDGGGKKFRSAFERSKLKDRVRFFSCAPAAKDPCELHARDPHRFKQIIEALLAEAQSADSARENMQELPLESIEVPVGLSDDELALRCMRLHCAMSPRGIDGLSGTISDGRMMSASECWILRGLYAEQYLRNILPIHRSRLTNAKRCGRDSEQRRRSTQSSNLQAATRVTRSLSISWMRTIGF